MLGPKTVSLDRFNEPNSPKNWGICALFFINVGLVCSVFK